MTGFEFEKAPSPGTNRTATTTDCQTCGGDRLVVVPSSPELDAIAEIYERCPACNPAPTSDRPEVPGEAWWKR